MRCVCGLHTFARLLFTRFVTLRCADLRLRVGYAHTFCWLFVGYVTLLPEFGVVDCLIVAFVVYGYTRVVVYVTVWFPTVAHFTFYVATFTFGFTHVTHVVGLRAHALHTHVYVVTTTFAICCVGWTFAVYVYVYDLFAPFIYVCARLHLRLHLHAVVAHVDLRLVTLRLYALLLRSDLIDSIHVVVLPAFAFFTPRIAVYAFSVVTRLRLIALTRTRSQLYV